MLSAAREQQRDQQRIRDQGLREARRAYRRGGRFASRMVNLYQSYAIASALAGTDGMLAEQDIPATSEATPDPLALLTGAAVGPMLDATDTAQAFDRLVSTLILDAARTASAVDTVTRTRVTGHVRQVNPPCCSRCAILAGRVYRWSTGFQRHPRCDCLMVPTTEQAGRSLTTNPDALFRSGQIHGMSRADVQAVNQGADLAQVVNIRRKGAGLTEGSSVLVRGGRPTPQGVLRVASDKAEALDLFRRYGYVL